MGEVVDFSGFNTSPNFVIAEAKAGIAATTTACSIVTDPVPLFNEKYLLKCVQSKTDNMWQSFVEFTSTDSIVIGVYVEFSKLPPAGEDISFLQVQEVGAGVNKAIELRVEDVTGDLLIIDETNSEVASVSAPFSIDKFFRVELIFERSDTGSATLRIDGTSVAIVGSADFDDDTGNDIRIMVRGQGGNPVAGPTTTFFNSFYVKNECTDTGDFIGEFTVKRFQMALTGATPDSGDDLTAGDWKGVSDGNNIRDANYNGTPGEKSGYVIFNDFPGSGPNGKIFPHTKIFGAKWTWWGETRLVPNFILIYGNNDPIAPLITTTTTGTGLPFGKPWNIVQDVNFSPANRVPDSTQDFILGFGCVADADGDAWLREAWCFLLTSPPKTTVHIRGGHIRGGHWR